LRVLAICFVLLGSLQPAWCVSSWREALQSKWWPSTTGTVTSSQVLPVKVRGGTIYRATISYTYEVQGVSYEGRRVQVLEDGETSDLAQRTIDVFSVGRVVSVYFNPDDASEALLIPGSDFDFFLWLGVSLLAIVAGGCMSYFFWPSASARRAA
jgi:hypothetical protein